MTFTPTQRALIVAAYHRLPRTPTGLVRPGELAALARHWGTSSREVGRFVREAGKGEKANVK